jgi:hypothetical protein
MCALMTSTPPSQLSVDEGMAMRELWDYYIAAVTTRGISGGGRVPDLRFLPLLILAPKISFPRELLKADDTRTPGMLLPLRKSRHTDMLILHSMPLAQVRGASQHPANAFDPGVRASLTIKKERKSRR